jgi:hypothetical protein
MTDSDVAARDIGQRGTSGFFWVITAFWLRTDFWTVTMASSHVHSFLKTVISIYFSSSTLQD